MGQPRVRHMRERRRRDPDEASVPFLIQTITFLLSPRLSLPCGGFAGSRSRVERYVRIWLLCSEFILRVRQSYRFLQKKADQEIRI